ncbi:hypothetical protein HPB49_012758 [Dermacentor silvarum]|uniref:Uncharacterized protein n=1 Tax=Dermacentor silvarum TaxID=543639 RepID=A0ACB8CRG2_DERSI|nr:hypothetical protein HPB49_012758 [Dermacentor silvarum]
MSFASVSGTTSNQPSLLSTSRPLHPQPRTRSRSRTPSRGAVPSRELHLHPGNTLKIPVCIGITHRIYQQEQGNGAVVVQGAAGGTRGSGARDRTFAGAEGVECAALLCYRELPSVRRERGVDLGVAVDRERVRATRRRGYRERRGPQQWVYFPKTSEEKAAVKEGFLRRGAIPGVIGCVDGSLISIIAPKGERKAAFMCCKSYYALNSMFGQLRGRGFVEPSGHDVGAGHDDQASRCHSPCQCLGQWVQSEPPPSPGTGLEPKAMIRGPQVRVFNVTGTPFHTPGTRYLRASQCQCLRWGTQIRLREHLHL